MKSSWSIEIIRLMVVIFSAIIVGLSSDYWLLSVSIHSLAYILWLLLQLKEYTDWLSRGAHKKEAPDSRRQDIPEKINWPSSNMKAKQHTHLFDFFAS